MSAYGSITDLIMTCGEIDPLRLEPRFSHLTDDDLSLMDTAVQETTQYLAHERSSSDAATGPYTYQQLACSILARLLVEMDIDVFRGNLPDLARVLGYAVENDMNASDDRATDRIVAVLTVLFTHPPVATLWRQLELPKLNALISTIWYRESDRFGFQDHSQEIRWSPERIRLTINESLPCINVVTEEDGARVQRSDIGMIFRGSYVGERYPFGSVVFDYVKCLPDDLVEKLHDIYVADTTSAWLINEFMQSKRTVAEIEEACFFIETLKGAAHGHWWRILTSLRATSGTPKTKNFSRESEQVRAQGIALITVMAGVATALDTHMNMIPGVDVTVWDHHDSSDTWYLDDLRLVRFICDNPERAPEIAAFVIERGTLDYEALMSVLSVTTPVLRVGAL